MPEPTPAPDDPLYNEEEARAILHRASRVSPRHFTRAQLREMAEELGIDPTQLATAEAEWQAEHERAQQRDAALLARRQALLNRLAGLAVLMVLLMVGMRFVRIPWFILALSLVSVPVFLALLATTWQSVQSFLPHSRED